MNTSFRFRALPYEPFAFLFDLDDAELAARGARRTTVAEKPGVPCRVSLLDAEIGETAVLVPFAHHDVASPYRASGPIYVRERARQATPEVGEVPELLRHRLLSLRAYDEDGMMICADVAEGRDVERAIAALFGNPAARYLDVHNARPGCFACRVLRADSPPPESVASPRRSYSALAT